jgi:hypothetical protein
VRSFARLLVFALALWPAAVLAACGDGGGESKGAAPETASPGTTVYRSEEYGVSLTYDERFSRMDEAAAQAEGGGNAVLSVGFFDKDGTVAGDSYVDGLLLTVYQLKRAVNPADVPGLKKEFEALVDELEAKLEQATMGPLEEVVVNGTPGFGVVYAFQQDEVELAAVSYFLVKGDLEYQITAQSSRASWEQVQPLLRQAMDSIVVD